MTSDDSEIFGADDDRVAALFPRYQVLLDQAFGAEFSRRPEQRYWELAVADILEQSTRLQLKWDRRQPTNPQIPDFVATFDEREIWVEATAPGKSENANAALAIDRDR